ncbi:hypothetical protein [Novosphingobium pentaromativorans]|uniref:Uncharacterized protein n=1 Tax=Novosphingobium pentaromativorans US6-1 TaxID=1088721 RepID=G6EHD4_9SPHN|nr:hypothetical protein [Novosphingobium pentaromativorans]AIT81908.1 hypothetical protein JI59_20260 [Novosphingobium pentaromativorans US6-1]EHJ59423.1 hypothetical protein NSU_3755 [Novosphingobium pentaromativorans US6-1]
MSIARNLAELGKLLSVDHGWPAAKAFKSYRMTESDRTALSARAVDLLKVFPPEASGAAMMSAALCVSLEGRLSAPVYLVAGTLTVGGDPIIGNRQRFDGPGVFASSNPEWDGHVWAMVGPYVVDISIFRIAYSGTGPASLARHVLSTFGPNKGLYVDLWRNTGRVGLGYEPQYVLGNDEVTALMQGAYRVMTQAAADRDEAID